MFAAASWFPTIVALAAAAVGVRGQGDLSSTNNITSLEGTWSSNVHVQTGGVSPARRESGVEECGVEERSEEATEDEERASLD